LGRLWPASAGRMCAVPRSAFCSGVVRTRCPSVRQPSVRYFFGYWTLDGSLL